MRILVSLQVFLFFDIFTNFSNCLASPDTDILLQCKTLLYSIRTIHPDFKSIVKSASYTKYNVKRDPYSQLRFLIRQGTLMCEMAKGFHLFHLQSFEQVDIVRNQQCYFPADKVDPDSSDLVERERSIHNLHQFLESWNQVAISQNKETLDYTVEQIQEGAVETIFDIIEVLEILTAELSTLLPLYPIMAFRMDDTSSESSYDTLAKKNHKSLKSRIDTQLHSKVLQELIQTEKKYIENLVKMEDYSYLLKSPRISNELCPNVNKIKDFHLQFFMDLQRTSLSVMHFANLFSSFHEVLPYYNQWVEHIQKYPTEDRSISSIHQEANQWMPLDNSVGGLNSMRIVPIQRLLKYPLLLKEFMKDSSLEEGIEGAEAKRYLEIAHSIMIHISVKVNRHQMEQEMIQSKKNIIQKLQNSMIDGNVQRTAESSQTITKHQNEHIHNIIRGMELQTLILESKGYLREMKNSKVEQVNDLLFYLFSDGMYLFSSPNTLMDKPHHHKKDHQINSVNKKRHSAPKENPENSNLRMKLQRSISTFRHIPTRTRSNSKVTSFSLHTIFLFHDIIQLYRLDRLDLRFVLKINNDELDSNLRQNGKSEWKDLHFEQESDCFQFYEFGKKTINPSIKRELIAAHEMITLKILYLSETYWIFVKQDLQFGEIVQEIADQIFTSFTDINIVKMKIQNWKLKWLDEDDDWVTLVENEDWELALGDKKVQKNSVVLIKIT